MMLTLSQPGKPEFGLGHPHELASPKPHSAGTHFDRILGQGPPNSFTMSTSHRGLPPPSVMSLPDPNRPPPQAQYPAHQQQTMPPQASLGQMPAPLPQWQGGEDSMRHWLTTKAEEERTKQEEEKRRQEEERSRQESLKLEQRLVEQSILRESMQGGIPAHMIPVIFAGIGGPNLVSASVELLQQYASQLQASKQQVQAHSKAVLESPAHEQADPRMAAPPPQMNAFPVTSQPPSIPAQPPPPPAQHQTSFQAYVTPGRAAPTGPTSAPRPVQAPGLFRINAIDVAQPAGPAAAQSSVHSSQLDQPTSSSPSIYFHHWVPPATQESKPPQASTPQPRHDIGSVSSDVEMRDSPRKRKAVGGHAPVPPPPMGNSPTFSSHSSTRGRGDSTGHMRSRSNKSNEELQDMGRRPPSRRDSVATQLRMHEHAFQHDAHARPQSHASDRGNHYMR